METTTTTEKKGLLSSLLGDVGVNTNVGISQQSIMQIGAILFVSVCLIILAYFSFKKLFNS